VINNTAPVSKKTRAAVEQAIQELNYRPHAAARGLASNRTRTLGLLLPRISGDYFAPMLRGIEEGAREFGYHLLIYSTQGKPISADPLAPEPLGEHNTDGLIVFTNSLPQAKLRYLYEIGFPITLLHRNPPEDTQIPYVTIENKDGTRALIDHLIEVHNYRRIAFLTGPRNNDDSYWRERGYREALHVHGIEVDERLIGMGDFDEAVARETVSRWLNNGVEFDAVFSGDDDAAIGVMAALRQAGRRIPEDVAVVGFDDTSISRFLQPPLTTVRAPIERAGYEAISQLIRLIQEEKPAYKVLLPTQVVIRQSCGCHPDDRP
jgi:DNA-binding LacI/PurR family transcriptional regulator